MHKIIFFSLIVTIFQFNTNIQYDELKYARAHPADTFELKASNEPLYNSQKNLNYLNLGNTLDNYRGDGVKVAIIDSGINIDHQEFKDINGYKYTDISLDSAYLKRNAYSITAQTINNYGYNIIDDTNGHGTEVAGTIASRVNELGITGIAPNVELMILKTEYYLDQLEYGIRYAVDHGADIINLSVQAYKEDYSNIDTFFNDAVKYAKDNGVIIVAAAGNKATSEKCYPASCDDVIGVGALKDGTNNQKAEYSNYGTDNVYLVAPGTFYLPSIESSTSYVTVQGTSFASPAVSGAIALFKSKFPNATYEQVLSKLDDSLIDLNDRNYFGNGRIDISRYLEQYPILSAEFNSHYIEMTVGEVLTPKVNILPENATNKNMLFMADNEDIISIDEETGTMTALQEGNTTIYFLTDDGNFMDECEVVVRSGYVGVTKASLGFSYQDIDTLVSKTISMSVNTTIINSNFSNAANVTNYFDITDENNNVNDLVKSVSLSKNSSSYAYIGGSNKEVRLYYNSYGDGTSLDFVTLLEVSKIKISFLLSSNSGGKCGLVIDNEIKEIESDQEYDVNSNNFKIKNIATSNVQVKIRKIELKFNIGEKGIHFSNVRAKFTAHIDKDIFESLSVIRAGVIISIPYSSEIMNVMISLKKISFNEDYYFTAVITNIPKSAYEVIMTATGYLVLEDESIIYLKSRSISIKEMVENYLYEGNPFELSKEDIYLMNQFQTYCSK